MQQSPAVELLPNLQSITQGAPTPGGTRGEGELIARVQHGEANAFEALYHAHKRRTYSLCLRMVTNPAVAEEVTQEAFLTAFRRIQTFRGQSSFSTWLHRVTVNCALMYLRQQRSRIGELAMAELNLEGDEDVRPMDFGSPDEILCGVLDRVALERALSQLPPGYRIIWVLHDVEGYEHSEIAEMLGCSVGNTKSQLHKARLKMRKMLRAHSRDSLRRSSAITAGA